MENFKPTVTISYEEYQRLLRIQEKLAEEKSLTRKVKYIFRSRTRASSWNKDYPEYFEVFSENKSETLKRLNSINSDLDKELNNLNEKLEDSIKKFKSISVKYDDLVKKILGANVLCYLKYLKS